MKKFITAAMITTCLALCAAVWPQTEMVEETPVPPQTPAVSAPKQTVTEVDLEAVIALPAEEEKSATPQQEPPYETTHEPEPVPMEVPAVPEVQPTPETEPAPDPAPT